MFGLSISELYGLKAARSASFFWLQRFGLSAFCMFFGVVCVL